MSSLPETTTFQPYGFLLRPRQRKSPTPPSDFAASSASAGCSLDTSVQVQTPPSPSVAAVCPPSPTTAEPVFDPAIAHAISQSEHGRHLGDKLEFIIPPQGDMMEADLEVNGRARCLFVGQLRFETTPAELRYLVRRLVGVEVLKIEIRGPGCFVLYVACENDEAMVRALNRRLLFDHNGVWFARSPDATDLLLDYVEKVMPNLRSARRRALRLPRDCIVIEDSRTKKNPTQSVRSSNASSNRGTPYHHHQNHQSPNCAPACPPSYFCAPPPYSTYSNSEPSTPSMFMNSASPHHHAQQQQQAQGFHGMMLPDYVLGAEGSNSGNAAPPPYTTSYSPMWH